MADTQGRGLLVVGMDIASEHEEEFNRWYDETHLAERLQVPGFINGRRFQSVDGSPKYIAIYDMESPDVINSEAYRNHVMSDWDRKMTSLYDVKVRWVYRDITKPIGAR